MTFIMLCCWAYVLVIKLSQLNLPWGLSIANNFCFLTLFFSERRLEDHEIVLDVCSKWSPDSGNMLMFRNVATKYALFEKPQVSQ